jgi:hypothetical protein
LNNNYILIITNIYISGFSNAFEYLPIGPFPLGVAGKALGGWTNPKANVFQPRCCFIDAFNKNSVDAFIAELFEGSMKLDDPTGEMTQCFCASILRYYSTMNSDLGENNMISEAVTSAAYRVNVLSYLKQWGKAVHEDWIMRNYCQELHGNISSTLLSNDSLTVEMVRLQGVCREQGA